MAVNSFSQFWLLDPVTNNNFYIPFDEGVGELNAEVKIGEYTVTSIVIAIQDALNTIGLNTYTVTFDRSTRKYTITGSGTFSLLLSSGSTVGVDVFSLLGFSGADTVVALSHESNGTAGAVFAPQFKLQSYTSTEDFQEATSAAISQSAAGEVEIVSFGQTQFGEFNIMFATNIAQLDYGPIRNNLTGIEDVRNFLLFATKKYPFEFIIDESDINTFETVLLEKTAKNSKGVGFLLKEMISKNLPGYYETEKLTIRKIT